jgi:hypothetical protein
MKSIIDICNEFIEQYIKDNNEFIDDIDKDILNNNAYLYEFGIYLFNHYNHLIRKLNNDVNIKSFYVRYCNKYLRENDDFIKYNIGNTDLVYYIIYCYSKQNIEYIESHFV